MEELKVIRVVRGLPGSTQENVVQFDAETCEISLIEQSKTRTFSPDLSFPPSASDLEVSNELLTALSLPSLLTSARSHAVLTYGPRDSGKSSLLFSEHGLLATLLSALSDLMQEGALKLLISASEIVYAESAATEVWVDLLNPENESPRKAMGWVEVGSELEAREVVDIAQRHASSWDSSGLSPRLLNNRGHTLIDLLLCSASSQSRVSLLDLAGFQPSKTSPDLRAKLPGDQQLMFTRMGLLHLRTFLRNWAEGKEREASHRFKVVTGVEEALSAARVMVAVCLRQDCGFADAVNALELLDVVKDIETETGQADPRPVENVKQFAELASSASHPHSDSPLKLFATFNAQSQCESHPDICEDQKPEDTKDWLSQFDARLSRIMSRSLKATPKHAASESSNRPVTLESFQMSQSGGCEEQNEAEIVRLREDCCAMEAQARCNDDESAALIRHISGLEMELQALKREVNGQLAGVRKDNEALASTYDSALIQKGGNSVEDVYAEDFAVLEERIQRVAELSVAVRVLAEEELTERSVIKALKGIVEDMNSECQDLEETIAGMKTASRKWDMAEKCYSNVRRHIQDLELELTTLDEKIKRQESKAEMLMNELMQEKQRFEELTRAKGEAKMENSKLTLTSVRQKNAIALRSNPGNASLTTNAGAGGIQKSVRYLQDALRKSGSLQEMNLASQLLSQVQTLTDELRKRKVRTRNMSAKVKRLQTSPKDANLRRADQPSANVSDGKIPKFSFS